MENLLAHCAQGLAQHSSVLVTLFLGGLTGGFTHCLAMCGAFSACQNACAAGGCATQKTPASTVSDRLNVPHHLGRMLSYGLLGALTALFARQLAAYSFWPTLEAAMLLLAGAMFLGSSIASFMSGKAHHAPQWFMRAPSRLMRGALLGFLPCGLIYAALMVVSATANPWIGFVGMVLFVVGTLPALWTAGLGVELLSRRWRDEVRQVGRVVMAMNGVALVAIAGKLVM